MVMVALVAHEAAQAEDGVVHAGDFEVLLDRGLHLHQRHLLVLVALVDGVEHVALDAHGRGGLDARNLGLPVDGVGVLLRARGGGVDDGVDADEGYTDLVKSFTCDKYDANEYVELMMDAGAKFGGLGVVHHEGYLMWDPAPGTARLLCPGV